MLFFILGFYLTAKRIFYPSLENQFIYPIPKGSKLIFFAPLGVGVNEENQFVKLGEIEIN